MSGRSAGPGRRPAARLPDSEARNGIARDEEGRRLFVTGKKWPTLFEIETVEPAP